MENQVEKHYATGSNLANSIAVSLSQMGKSPENLNTTDLSTFDEFHIRGRKATLELGNQMRLDRDSRVIDVGSGLGGPARTLAESFGCHVTGD